jgi:hypothetical protein
LTRWLENERIAVHALYGPLLQRALAEWGHQLGYLALDPSTRWHTYGVVRLSLVYRGRAMPLVWNVLDHPSRRVGYAGYQELLEKGAELLPCGCPVVFPADRGLADTPRMDPLVQLGWPWRIRIKGSFWVDRLGKRACNVKRMPWSPGKALFWHHVSLTKQAYGPVPLALGRPNDTKGYW